MTSQTIVSRRAADAVVGELIRQLLSSSDEPACSLLSRLGEAVRVYEIEFRSYLNGQGQRPPLQLGAVLSTVFQELAAPPGHRAADFQVEALEARFHVARRLLTQRLDRADRRLPARAAQHA